MTHSYKINGMTCMGCLGTVQKALVEIPEVEDVQINLADGRTNIRSKELLNLEVLAQALGENGKYSITEMSQPHTGESGLEEVEKTYNLYPLYLVFTYLIGMVLLSQVVAGSWNSSKAMQNFMGGFFLLFSFFKMLDIKGFAHAFSAYDPIAKRWIGYAYLYPFLEVILGILFLTGIQLFWTNIFTLVLLLIGSTGVLESVLQKRTIQCACLGSIFNLPMTYITLLENGLMIIMSCLMISKFL